MLNEFPLRIAKDRNRTETEIALALILKSHDQSATQMLKKLDLQFFPGTGRLDRYLLEDEASAQHSVLNCSLIISFIVA